VSLSAACSCRSADRHSSEQNLTFPLFIRSYGISVRHTMQKLTLCLAEDKCAEGKIGRLGYWQNAFAERLIGSIRRELGVAYDQRDEYAPRYTLGAAFIAVVQSTEKRSLMA